MKPVAPVTKYDIGRRAYYAPAPAPPRPSPAAEPDDARHALRAAVDQRNAPAALGKTQLRALGCDAQVAPQRQLEAPRQAEARDRRDGGLGGSQPREPERPPGQPQALGERLD